MVLCQIQIAIFVFMMKKHIRFPQSNDTFSFFFLIIYINENGSFMAKSTTFYRLF